MTTLHLVLLVRRLYSHYCIFDIPESKIEEGAMANLTLFDPDEDWKFSSDDILSKSHNSPLIDRQLKGRALGVMNNGLLSVLE